MITKLCTECQLPLTSGWGRYCSKCFAKRERHNQQIKAINNTVDKFCEEAIKNKGFFYKGKEYAISELFIKVEETEA